MEVVLGWLKWLFGSRDSKEKSEPDVESGRVGDVDDSADPDPTEEVVFEIGDVLDLHSFPPKEIKFLVRDYLDHAVEQGWDQVRIIHGKGIGVQRRTVRAILEKDPRVREFGDPPGESGGWGATWVRLSPRSEKLEA